MKKIFILLIAIFILNVANAQWQQIYFDSDWCDLGCGKAECLGIINNVILVGTSNCNGSNNIANCLSAIDNSIDDGNSWNIGADCCYWNTTIENGNDYYIAYSKYVQVNSTNNYIPIDTISGNYITSLAINGTNIYTGTTKGIYLSIDSAKSWIALDTGLTNTYINALATIFGYVYAGTNGGVFLYGTGGCWYPWSIGITDTTITAITNIGSNIFAGTKNKGVFLSTDYGESWSAVNTGLTNMNIQTLKVRGTNIFAGTNGGGVFLSKDNGNSWNPVNNGISNLNVWSMAFNDSSIYVLTNDWPGLNKRKLLDILNRPVDAGSITGDINICQGEDLVTFVVPKIDNATSYIWTLPNNTIETTNTNSISVHFDSTSISGYISVTGNNSFGNGSISKLYINIIPQTFTPNILGNPNPQPYSEELYSVSQQLGKTYNWTVTNGNILNGLGTNYINVQWGNTGFGQVNVNVVDTNNSICSYSPFLKVNIGNVGIESLANNGVSIYPNPFIEELTIETNSDKVQRLEILNLMGQTVYTSYINNKKTTINTSAFANGVYILKLYTDKETVVRKFIKE